MRWQQRRAWRSAWVGGGVELSRGYFAEAATRIIPGQRATETVAVA